MIHNIFQEPKNVGKFDIPRLAKKNHNHHIARFATQACVFVQASFLAPQKFQVQAGK